MTEQSPGNDQASAKPKWKLWAALAAMLLIAAGLSLPAGREAAGTFFRSLRMQKVQAVNVDLSPFTDPNANPTLHQMVAQMISDKVVVTANEKDQPAADAAAATPIAGFPVQLLGGRKDAPKLVVGGQHAVKLTVDRARLQAIFTEAGHPELTVPAIARRRDRRRCEFRARSKRSYGTCPGPTTATDAHRQQHHRPDASVPTQYSDCVRLREGPSPDGECPRGSRRANTWRRSVSKSPA